MMTTDSNWIAALQAKSHINVLYVEDDSVDQRAFVRHVEKEGCNYVCDIAGSVTEARQYLGRQAYDVVISDYRLGDGDGLDLLKEVGETPFILVTGMGDEETAVRAMKLGAYDYLTKDPALGYLKILPLTVEGALAFKAQQQALRESEERFRIMADSAPVLIWMTGQDNKCTYFNLPWLALTGRTMQQELDDGWTAVVHPEDVQHCLDTYQQAFDARRSFKMELRLRRKDGAYRWMFNTGTPRYTPDGSFAGYIGSCFDITDRRDAEEKLKQMYSQIEKSHDDLLSILGQLRIGVIMTDDQGAITFVSPTCLNLLGTEPGQVLSALWQKVCPFGKEDKARLQDMYQRPAGQREKVSLKIKAPAGEHYWMDVDIQDDPRDSQRRIFFMYDMTAVQDLRRIVNDKATVHGIVGKSPPMQTVYEQMQQLARLDTTILIEGDTGTGKELVARAIHNSGHRQDKPFVALNCAGLAESLLASQLFGHKRGSFTGAIEDQPGHFEAANEGTLFLDEIGDISTSVQTSLLRVLQEREIIRIGESKPRKVDVRIIAATHRDLNQEVQEGRFRADLLYRIRVARITLPLLSERKTDIPLLIQTFMRNFRASSGKEVHEISQDAMQLLIDYHWPGNVRELQSAIEFAAIRCRGTMIEPADLPPEIQNSTQEYNEVLQHIGNERDRILAALEKSGGNRKAAAQLLGMSRTTFYRRLSELEIKPS